MNKILAIAACLLLQSCGGQQKEATKLERINWINGSWITNGAEGTATESWNTLNDSTLEGMSESTDTAGNVLSSEKIRIVLRDNTLWYIPTVSNENSGKPVSFREASFTDTMVVFENKEHDFPKRIVYVKKQDDKILAYIEGEIGGSLQRIDFLYQRQ